MKKVLLFLLLAFALCQCTPRSKSYKPSDQPGRSQFPEKFATEYINNTALRLIDFVPDHHFDPSCKSAFSERYYSLLEEAWAIPVDDAASIGDDSEWLYYFMSGNGDCLDQTKTILETVTLDDYNAYVKMNYLCLEHDIVFHFEGDDWVIDNFDGTLDRLNYYVKTQREYLRNMDWQAYANDAFKAKVDAYFAKYPNDRK